MARFFRVQDADRPDLAAIGNASQADLKGYAFPKIFPVIYVGETSGMFSVAPAGLTTAKGTKGRANGTALDATGVTPVDVAWSCARFEGRARIYENDGASWASEEACDQAGAETSQRLAWNKVEDEAFAKIFTTARKGGAAELADHAVVKTLQQKAKTLRAYGRPVLVMTTNTWMSFVEIPEIRHRLEKFAGAGNDVGFLAADAEKVRAAVSTLMGFADIVLFDADIVDADGTYDGLVAVLGLRRAQPNMLQAIKTRATYGWTTVYLPDAATGDKPFDMRTWYDNTNKANVYDAEAYVGIVEAFAAGVTMTKLASAYTEYAVPVVNVAQAAGS